MFFFIPTSLVVLACGLALRKIRLNIKLKGFFPPVSSAFDPLAHLSLCYPHRHRDIFLFPSLLFQFSCEVAPLFSPIDFLWCTHTPFYRLGTLRL
jgi:hypothetical protein